MRRRGRSGMLDHRALNISETRAKGNQSTGLARSHEARGPLSHAETERSGDGISPAPYQAALIGRAPTDLAGLQQRAMITCSLPTGGNRSRRLPGMASERAPLNITLRGPRCIRGKYWTTRLSGDGHAGVAAASSNSNSVCPRPAHRLRRPLQLAIDAVGDVLDAASTAAFVAGSRAVAICAQRIVETFDSRIVPALAALHLRGFEERRTTEPVHVHVPAAITRTASAKITIAVRMWRSWRVMPRCPANQNRRLGRFAGPSRRRRRAGAPPQGDRRSRLATQRHPLPQ